MSPLSALPEGEGPGRLRPAVSTLQVISPTCSIFGVPSSCFSRSSPVASRLYKPGVLTYVFRSKAALQISRAETIEYATAHEVTATSLPIPTTVTVIFHFFAEFDFARSRSVSNPTALASASQYSIILSNPSQASYRYCPTATMQNASSRSSDSSLKTRSVIHPQCHRICYATVQLSCLRLGSGIQDNEENSPDAITCRVPPSQEESQDAQLQSKTRSVSKPNCHSPGCVFCQLSCPCSSFACAFSSA